MVRIPRFRKYIGTTFKPYKLPLTVSAVLTNLLKDKKELGLLGFARRKSTKI